MQADWDALLQRMAGLRVLVIGEAMLDRYLRGRADRLCREAPVPIVALDGVTEAPGGAANVAVNVASIGAEVSFVSLTGDDAEGESLRVSLAAAGVDPGRVVVQPGRSTLAKQRVLAGSQMLLRFDQGSTDAASPAAEQALMETIRDAHAACDTVIVSDYGYGVLTPAVIAALRGLQELSPRPLFVDAKDYGRYRDLKPAGVKPNYDEALRLAGEHGPGPAALRRAQVESLSGRILEATGATAAAVTLDEDGAVLLTRDAPPFAAYASPLPGARGAGAGDSFLAAFALAVAAGAPAPEAAMVATAASAVAVGQDGTAVCTRPALRAKLYTGSTEPGERRHLIGCIEEERRRGRRVVFTNGCFDIVHSGHTAFLRSAKALGDVLVVGLNSDESVTRLKGIGRPVNRLADRYHVLAALGCVDYVVPFEEDTPEELVRLVRPDVFVKGGDYRREDLPEAPLVESLGGVVRILPYVEDHSTTAIIERIARNGGGHD